MRKLIPLLLGLIGLVGGAAAGHFLRPPPEEAQAAAACEHEPCAAEVATLAEELGPDAEPAAPGPWDYVEFEDQFVIPVVAGEKVASLMVVALTLEIAPGASDQVFAREPRLRDLLLRTLLQHAQSGGFDGAFAAEHVLRDLRRNLRHAAHSVLGDVVHDVLVTNIVKQDQ